MRRGLTSPGHRPNRGPCSTGVHQGAGDLHESAGRRSAQAFADQFVHEADSELRARCEAFFQCPVVFGDTHTRVRIPVSYMQIPMRHPEPGLRALLDGQAEALLRALPEPGDFDQAVQRLLLRVLPEGGVSVHRLAKMMNQSERTLQRRLGDQGLTWQMLLDRTREQLARQYLRDPALSVCEVAMMLGYSDQSAFTKAFKALDGRYASGLRACAGTRIGVSPPLIGL